MCHVSYHIDIYTIYVRSHSHYVFMTWLPSQWSEHLFKPWDNFQLCLWWQNNIYFWGAVAFVATKPDILAEKSVYHRPCLWRRNRMSSRTSTAVFLVDKNMIFLTGLCRIKETRYYWWEIGTSSAVFELTKADIFKSNMMFSVRFLIRWP